VVCPSGARKSRLRGVTAPESSSKAKPRIRLATRADIPALSALRVALFLELGAVVPSEAGQFLQACHGGFEAMYDASSGIAWVAETDDGALVGGLTLLFFARLPSPQNHAGVEGYVVGVYTEPEWRGRGVATALMSASLEAARQRGLARIRLHATEKGRRVYASQGFRLRNDEMELVL